MNPLVVIPTYISTDRHPQKSSIIATYDHCTPLSFQGELPRCLDSLRHVRGLGAVVILVVAEAGIENQAASKIRAVAEHFSDLDIVVIGEPEAVLVRQRMENDVILKSALLRSAGKDEHVGVAVGEGINPGATTEIRLNLETEE